jgi:hypothetical protein
MLSYQVNCTVLPTTKRGNLCAYMFHIFLYVKLMCTDMCYGSKDYLSLCCCGDEFHHFFIIQCVLDEGFC